MNATRFSIPQKLLEKGLKKLIKNNPEVLIARKDGTHRTKPETLLLIWLLKKYINNKKI